jgi:hypothetical protein
VPKLKATPADAAKALALLRTRGYPRAAARSRSDLLTITTLEPQPWPLTRFRRLSSATWQLEMPTHTGRWETTPFHASIEELIDTLVTDFPWTIDEASGDPVRT